MSSRNGRYRLSCDFQGSNSLIPRNGRECRQELLERIASFEIVEQALHGHARADENGCSAHDLWVGVDDFVTFEHAGILPRWARHLFRYARDPVSG